MTKLVMFSWYNCNDTLTDNLLLKKEKHTEEIHRVYQVHANKTTEMSNQLLEIYIGGIGLQ